MKTCAYCRRPTFLTHETDVDTDEGTIEVDVCRECFNEINGQEIISG